MLRFVLYLLTALDLALLVWGGGQIHPTIIPDLPPPPTLSPVMENNTIFVHIGENVTVRENVKVTMDCIKLVNILIDKGDNNSKIKWIKDGMDLTNGSAVNVIISGDERYCIITGTRLAVGGQLGNAGSYTCKVCDSLGDGTECENRTSTVVICDKPHIELPANPALIFPTSVVLTCGEDVTVDSLVNITVLSFLCTVFNGTEPYTMSIYKDGNLISYTAPIVINPTDDHYGTYTFVVSNELCGSDIAVSRLLQRGDPPDIDEGPHVDEPDTITKGNKRVKIGTPVYVFNGYNVTIDCNTVNGTPPITITWLHNGTIIAENVNTITVTDAKDGNIVTCRVDNNIGFDEEHITIHVKALPLLEISHPVCNPSIVGNKYTFTFEPKNIPQVQYTCSLNNRQSQSCNEGKVVYKNLKKKKKQVFTVTASTANGECTVSKNFTFIPKYDRNFCQVYTCDDGVVIIGSSANVTFTSDDPGATFQCKLNGKRIRPCSAPLLQLKNLSPGTHKFVIKPSCATRAKGKRRSIKFKIQ